MRANIGINPLIAEYFSKTLYISIDDIHYFGYDERIKSYKVVYMQNGTTTVMMLNLSNMPNLNRLIRKLKISEIKNAK
jgi:hypothetical protein